MIARSLLSGVVALWLLSGCSAQSAPVDLPRVDLIDEAVAELGSEREYFEVAADASGVTLVLRLIETEGDADEASILAEVHRFEDGRLARIAEPVEADGAHFIGSAIALDPDRIFGRILDELDASTVLDLAVQGSPEGRPVYDARVRGSRGGILLVLLGPDGAILGVQAE